MLLALRVPAPRRCDPRTSGRADVVSGPKLFENGQHVAHMLFYREGSGAQRAAVAAQVGRNDFEALEMRGKPDVSDPVRLDPMKA